jgi:N-formylglutamate deformylase
MTSGELPIYGGGDESLSALVAEPVVIAPASRKSPFIFASPHSGSVYPAGFVKKSRLDAVALRKSEDAFVDELFATVTELGAPLLTARFPRVFVDANRAPSELDPAMFDGPLGLPIGPRTPRVAAGLGVIPRVVRDGLEIYGMRIPAAEAHFRLEHFYRPYHAALSKLIGEARAECGVAIVIDCHSMPPPSRGSDIVLGDCYGEAASQELSLFVQRTLAACGFSIARNTPYAGGYTTRLYGKPDEGVHALQIEISRALYLDEGRMTRAPGFAACRERLRRFAESLTSASGPWLMPMRPSQAAAE